MVWPSTEKLKQAHLRLQLLNSRKNDAPFISFCHRRNDLGYRQNKIDSAQQCHEGKYTPIFGDDDCAPPWIRLIYAVAMHLSLSNLMSDRNSAGDCIATLARDFYVSVIKL